MMNAEEQNLNADAIYAGMVWLRDYANSQQGKDELAELYERKADKLAMFRSMSIAAGGGSDAAVRMMPIPRFEYTDELLESIYPGEALSVEVGLNMARYAIWAPATNEVRLEAAQQRQSPMDEALLRFLADEAH